MPRDIDQILLDNLARIEDKFDRITDKISNLDKKQAVLEERQVIHVHSAASTAREMEEIRRILEGQHVSLVDHVQRSNLLQARQEEFLATQNEFRESLKFIADQIHPIVETRSNSTIIREYEARKRAVWMARLTDWKTVLGFVTAAGSVLAYFKGWF